MRLGLPCARQRQRAFQFDSDAAYVARPARFGQTGEKRRAIGICSTVCDLDGLIRIRNRLRIKIMGRSKFECECTGRLKNQRLSVTIDALSLCPKLLPFPCIFKLGCPTSQNLENRKSHGF